MPGSFGFRASGMVYAERHSEQQYSVRKRHETTVVFLSTFLPKGVKTNFLSGQRSALLLLAAATALSASAASLQLVSTLDPAQEPPSGGGGDSATAVISPDGRFVLFASTANNLALVGTNPLPVLVPPPLNVFLRDRASGTTTLVSVNAAGTGGGNGDSLPAGLSTNGQFALFESSASDLVAGDTNDATDIFVRNLLNGTTLLVSTGTNGVSANGVSRSSVMTPDGRYVALVSAASNLAPGDTNGIADVFVRDLQTGVTRLVSVGASLDESFGPATSSEAPDITPDGRYVVFSSTASKLTPAAVSNGVYVCDLVGGATVLASLAPATVQATFGKRNPVFFNHAISADGRFVAYAASATPTGNSPSNPATSGVILRYNVQTGATDVVNTNAFVPTSTYQESRNIDLTPDGRFLAFVAVTNDASGSDTCILAWDGQTGTATLASGDLGNAVPAGSTCNSPALDSSGRFVVFLSNGANLVTNLVAGGFHAYVRDVQAGVTTLVDVGPNGAGPSLPSVFGSVTEPQRPQCGLREPPMAPWFPATAIGITTCLCGTCQRERRSWLPHGPRRCRPWRPTDPASCRRRRSARMAGLSPSRAKPTTWLRGIPTVCAMCLCVTCWPGRPCWLA